MSTMHLAARLERLERVIVPSAAPTPCARCGGPPAPGKRQYVVEFAEPGESREHDLCPDCGRRLIYRIEFDKGG